MAITTRVAVAADAEAIAFAHTRAWQVAYDGIVPAGFLDAIDVGARTEHWRQNLTEGSLADGTPSPHNIVAERNDGSVVGFSCVGVWRDDPTDTSAGELWAIYVHPDHWGSGAGYALMQATIGHLSRSAVKVAYLWVLDDNALARRFYERQGWQADDVTKDDVVGGATITERRYSVSILDETNAR